MLLWRDNTRVGNFPRSDRTYLFGKQRDHCDRLSVESHKLNFVAFPALMHKHDTAYITLLQALFRQVSGKNNLIQLLNLRLLNHVVKRGLDGKMELRREPIKPMTAELQQIVEENK